MARYLSLARIDALIAKHERAIIRLQTRKLGRAILDARNAAILSDFDSGIRQLKVLARRHAIHPATAQKILRQAGRSPLGLRQKLAAEILVERANGMTAKEIARARGLSHDAVRQIVCRHNRVVRRAARQDGHQEGASP